MKNRIAWGLGCLSLSALVVTGCYKAEDYDAVPPHLLHLRVMEPDTVLADGVATVVLEATVTDDASPAHRKVIFKTTRGSFEDGKGDSVLADAKDNNQARVKLMSVKVGMARVTAHIGNVKADEEQTVWFTRAYPTEVTRVEVDSAAVSNAYNREVRITATLKSGDGKPSEETPVTFTVTDLAGVEVGFFVNGINTAKTDGKGQAVIRYSPGGVQYEGYLLIKAEAKDSAGATLSPATTRIFLFR